MKLDIVYTFKSVNFRDADKPDFGKSSVQVIKSGQARGYKNFDFSQKHFLKEGIALDERKLKKGDILINSTGVGTAGRVTQFDLDGDYVVDSHITILRPDLSKVLPDYLLYSLADLGFKNIEAMADGQSGQIELTLETIKEIRIPLPPIDIQAKFVEDVLHVNAQRIDTNKALLALNKSIEKEVSEVSGNEEVLGNLATFKNGLNYSREDNGELITIVGVKDFQNHKSPRLDQLDSVQVEKEVDKSYLLEPNDILVVRSNGSANLVGRFLFIKELTTATSFSGFTIRIRTSNSAILPRFLFYYLRLDSVRSMLKGDNKSNIKSLNQTLLASLKIPVPPIKEQERILSKIQELESEIETLEAKLDALKDEENRLFNHVTAQ